jgi:hypothetical protein
VIEQFEINIYARGNFDTGKFQFKAYNQLNKPFPTTPTMFNKVVMAVIAATATNAISLNKAPVPNQSPAENAMAPYTAPAGESAMTFPGQTPSLKVHKLFIKHFMEHAGAIKALVMKFPDFAKMAKEASPELVKPFMVNPRMALKKFIRKHPKATSEFFATHGDEVKAFCGASE